MRQLTVHPLLSWLIVDELDHRWIISPAGLLARRRLDAGRRLSVATQTQLLSELGRAVGPSGLVQLSEGITTSTARLAQHILLATLNSSTLSDALQKLSALGAHLHPTHRVELRQHADGVVALHQATRGSAPTTEETLFVFGLHSTVARLYGAEGLRGELIDRQGHLIDETALSSMRCQDLALSGWRLTWTASSTRIPIGALDEALRSSLQGIDVTPTVGHTLASTVARLIESDLGRRWTVNTIADHVAMSSRSLQRAINSEGASVRTIIHGARLSAAVRYLTSTDLPLDDVAWLCGYANASHLANTIKRRCGTTSTLLRGGAPQTHRRVLSDRP